MRISVQKNQTIANAKADIKRNLKYFRFKLRNCNGDVKEHLISSYGCSILRYLGTPLLGAKLVDENQIERMEASLFREAYSIPNSVGNKSILNLARRQAPVID